MTEAETNALRYLAERGGSVLVTAIPDKNERGLFGEIVPGLRGYQKLERQGLLYITEEEPCEDGFVFTPTIDLTESGVLATKN